MRLETDVISPREFVQTSMASGSDTLFAPRQDVQDFEFDQQVVSVFPNMIERSVPDYWAMVDGIGRIAQRRIAPNRTFFDLGCSLGAVAWSFYRHNRGQNPVVAVDCSQAMMRRFRLNLKALTMPHPMVLREEDIRSTALEDAGVVSLNLTLQFLVPEDRKPLLHRVSEALDPGGVLFLTEKIRFEDEELNALVRSLHHDFKFSQGYSRTEIAQKAASIHHVMRVDTMQTHRRRLAEVGFTKVTVWHQHYNFLSMMAEK